MRRPQTLDPPALLVDEYRRITPERLAKLEAESARAENGGGTPLPQAPRRRLDESASPTAGRRFTRA